MKRNILQLIVCFPKKDSIGDVYIHDQIHPPLKTRGGNYYEWHFPILPQEWRGHYMQL